MGNSHQMPQFYPSDIPSFFQLYSFHMVNEVGASDQDKNMLPGTMIRHLNIQYACHKS